MTNYHNDLISIVIPCYKQAHLLPQAIDSCLKQTYQNLEIIVVDDGSPDDVSGVTAAYGDSIRLVQKTNGGLSSARNAGIDAASGKFIKFLDSDDWLLPSCVEEQYLILRNLEGYIAVCGYVISADRDGTSAEYFYPDFGKFSHQLCYTNTGPPHTFLYSMESVRLIGGFDTSKRVDGGHEDYDFLCRLAVNGYDAVALHSAGCVYYKSGDSMSANLEKMSKTRGLVWRHYIDKCLEHGMEDDLVVHAINGYVLRIRCKDINYDTADTFNKLTDRLCLCNNISDKSIIAILQNLVILYKMLPTPGNKKDKAEYKRILHLSNRQIRHIVNHTSSFRSLEPPEIIDMMSALFMYSKINNAGSSALIRKIKAKLIHITFYLLILLSPRKLVNYYLSLLV